MHKAVPIFALVALLAGCGGDKQDPTPTPAATATATATVAADDPLAGYSEGVRKYYAGADPSRPPTIPTPTPRCGTSSRRGPPRPSSARRSS